MIALSERLKRRLLGVMFVLACALIVIGVTISQLADAPGPLVHRKDVILPEGTGILAIGRLMQKQGVVESRYLFPFFYILLEYHRPLKSGEYEFAAGASYRQVMRTLGSGITVVRKFTIPEGTTVAHIYKLLEENDALKGDLPSLAPEGTLLPETYYYSYGDTRQWLIERMQKASANFLAAAWEKREANLPITTPEEALTLASIVEKETGVGGERGRVASVYINRLRKHMKLQADPTVIYGITMGREELGRSLARSDLERPTPYNTYMISGLPPGPITNPGKDSIRAVLNPPNTKDLFFVADGKGGHQFSETYKQHGAYVQQYRATVKKEKAKERAEAEEAKKEVPQTPKHVPVPQTKSEPKAHPPVKKPKPAPATQ